MVGNDCVNINDDGDNDDDYLDIDSDKDYKMLILVFNKPCSCDNKPQISSECIHPLV